MIYDMIEINIGESGKTNKHKGKSPREGSIIRDLLIHTLKNFTKNITILEAIIYPQRTWCRSVHVASVSVSSCEFCSVGI